MPVMPEPIQTIDFSILDWIQEHIRNDMLDLIIPKITVLGDKGIFWIAVTLLCLFVAKWRKCGITMATALLVGLLIGNILIKLTVARDRPCWISPPEVMLVAIPKDTSFPSCHTLSGFAASIPLLYYFRRVGIPAVIFAGIIGLTRMYVYVHFPSDVLVGFILGVAIAIGTIWLTNKYLWQFLEKKFPKLLPQE